MTRGGEREEMRVLRGCYGGEEEEEDRERKGEDKEGEEEKMRGGEERVEEKRKKRTGKERGKIRRGRGGRRWVGGERARGDERC